MALDYRYVSSYKTAKGVATFVSAVGWVLLVISAAVLVIMLAGLSQAPQNQAGAMFIQSVAFIFMLSAIGGIVSGLLLIAAGQGSKATLDSADYSGEMLAITKASLDARNSAYEQRSPVSPSTTRLVLSTTANGPVGSEAEPPRPRSIEIPTGVENQKLSVRETAQAIGVTSSTVQDYIKSGRLTPNADGTINLYALYNAGFIIRNMPQGRSI